MTFKKAIREVESHEFAVLLNLASDLKGFFRAAEQQKPIEIIYKELDEKEKIRYLLEEIIELSKQGVDLRYENQWDIALAIYVWLINLKDPHLAKIAAGITLQIPQCWWAKKISCKILFGEYVEYDVNTKLHEKVFQGPKFINKTLNSGEDILLFNLISVLTINLKYNYNVQVRDKISPPGIQLWSIGKENYRIDNIIIETH